VNATELDLLADAEHLRAFASVLACDLGRPERVILQTIVAVLEREQRRRADDTDEVLRLGLVRRTATREIDRCHDRGVAMLTSLAPDTRAVLQLLATGLSTQDTADRLGLPVGEVRRHTGEALDLLGASTKLEAVIKAIQRGLIEIPRGCDRGNTGAVRASRSVRG